MVVGNWREEVFAGDVEFLNPMRSFAKSVWAGEGDPIEIFFCTKNVEDI